MKQKKAFILFSTIILVFIFSLLTIKIFETKAINSQNLINQYQYIQAKNHLSFLEEYIKSIKNLESIDKLQIANKNYDIKALVEKVSEKQFEIELIVKAINSNIRVYKKITLSST